MAETYGLGLFPSPPDDRDYQLASIMPAEISLPARYLAFPTVVGVPPVLNQGSSPHCVTYASTCMKVYQEMVDENKSLALDPVWLYKECKKVDGMPRAQGTFLRVAMGVLKAKGIPEKRFLFSSNASKHKIAAYYSVEKNVTAFKQAIKSFGPFVIGSKWYNSWFRLGPGYVLPSPDVFIAGHALLLWGWDDRLGCFYARNSWGRNWGSYGNLFIPYKYVNDYYIFDAYKTLDVRY